MRNRTGATWAIVMILLFVSCGDDSSPTSPTAPAGSSSAATTLTAPTIVSPEPGANVDTTTPELVVSNAAGGAGLSYTFEVASDSGFGALVASRTGIAQGDGRTSWRVEPPLETGSEYWWRARAVSSGQNGPNSDVASFAVIEGFTANRPTGGLVVFDPLTNGSSVGEVVGGTFNEKGWMATAADDYIRYQVPTLSEGYVEFEVTNIREPNPIPGKRMLMIMWDPTKGEYTTNPFRMHLQKMDRRTVSFDDVRLRWISRGQEHNTGVSFFDFQAGIVYPWRVEWGSYPGLSAQQVRVFLEGFQIMERNYDPVYHPKTHWIELGGGPRNETLEEAIFSNVRIGSR